MPEKTDRRCFLARGVLGAAGIGAAYSSIEEKTLLAATQDGSAQPGPSKPAEDRHPARQPALRQDPQRVGQPADDRRQPDRRLGP